jgi:hypothetical protein
MKRKVQVTRTETFIFEVDSDAEEWKEIFTEHDVFDPADEDEVYFCDILHDVFVDDRDLYDADNPDSFELDVSIA